MPGPSTLDFTAIDFETANRQRASVCAVGLARVKGGVVVATDSWLVVPPTGADAFDTVNIRVHGIRPRDVRRTGIDWRRSIARIEAFRSGSPLIAHNASFDQSVFAESCRAVGITPPPARWEDTLRIARQHLTLPDYKLPTVAEHLRVKGFKHHDAAADAEACARIVIGIAHRIGAADVNSLWPLGPKRAGSSRWSSGRATTAKVSELPQPAADSDPRHPLHGHRIVLTGELDGMDRWTAFERIAAAGGTPQKGVTLKTTMLIVSGRRRLPESYRPELGSQKEQKAAEYRDRGNAIFFLGHEDLLEALAWRSGITDNGTPAVLKTEPAPVAPPVTAGQSGAIRRRRSDDEPISPRGAGPSKSGDERRADGTTRSAHPVVPPTPHLPAPQQVPVSRPLPATQPAAPAGSANPAPELPVWSRSQPYAPDAAGTSRPIGRHDSGNAGSFEQPAHRRGGTSIGRKIVGWVLLVPSALLALLMLVLAVASVLVPGESLGIRVLAGVMILLMALVPVGLGFLGLYLIWLRDRWRSGRR